MIKSWLMSGQRFQIPFQEYNDVDFASIAYSKYSTVNSKEIFKKCKKYTNRQAEWLLELIEVDDPKIVWNCLLAKSRLYGYDRVGIVTFENAWEVTEVVNRVSILNESDDKSMLYWFEIRWGLIFIKRILKV